MNKQAEKASSVYKWLKENWRKLLVIIVTLFALIFVVGIYRRCFSSVSSSSGDDDEPSIVVVRMLKPENKERVECLDPVLAEDTSQRSGGSAGKNQEGPSSIQRKTQSWSKDWDNTEVMMTNGVKRTRKPSVKGSAQFHESFIPSSRLRERDIPAASSQTQIQTQQSIIVDIQGNSIPISGYTAFQQIQFSMFYFNIVRYLLEITGTDLFSLIRGTKGSISEGPFPFYEEIPLVEVLATSLSGRYRDDYLPTAKTTTNIPLTISL